jgi:hypothetical protein
MRLSVTDLDQYRIWLEMEDVGPEWLIDRLTKFEPSQAMEAGSAFHKCLEVATADLAVATADGFTFNFDLEASIELTNIRELKIVREVISGVFLVGRVDAVIGNCIRDYKATERYDAERYFESMQWRAYLDLFEVDAFEYSIFEIKEESARDRKVRQAHSDDDEGDNLFGTDTQVASHLYTVRDYHSLKMYAYPGLHDDVLRCVSDLADFIRRHNIEGKLTAKNDEMAI